MPNVFKEAKKLKRLHPRKHKKWAGYVKEAGQKLKGGGRKKAHRPKRKRVTVRHKPKMRRTPRAIVVVSGVHHKPARRKPRKQSRHKAKRVHGTRRSRVGKINTGTIVLVGAGLLAAYLLLKPKTTSAAPVNPTALGLVTTGNAVRDQSANNILAYAQAANLTAQAIAALIQHINSSSDSDVTSQGSMTYEQWQAWYNGD